MKGVYTVHFSFLAQGRFSGSSQTYDIIAFADHSDKAPQDSLPGKETAGEMTRFSEYIATTFQPSISERQHCNYPKEALFLNTWQTVIIIIIHCSIY